MATTGGTSDAPDARRAEIEAGLDFVLSHDAELLTRLEDA